MVATNLKQDLFNLVGKYVFIGFKTSIIDSLVDFRVNNMWCENSFLILEDANEKTIKISLSDIAEFIFREDDLEMLIIIKYKDGYIRIEETK